MSDYFLNRPTDKQATTLIPLNRVAIQQSHKVSLSFPELWPEMLREALVGDFTTSYFQNEEVDWLWGTDSMY